uniref:Large ribosomal subunit protein uL10m n=1 Tax=Parastrongyloides trichosuri TaxID=131310 RepID=A0A0N4Z6J5_PARTI
MFLQRFNISLIRNVSSKYIRPHPRHYKRRWFEAAVAPILPEEKKMCTPKSEIKEAYELEKNQYLDIELALAAKVKKWIIDEDFHLMAYCQLLPVQGRTKRLATNQLRLKGIEAKTYSNKIMRKVFENTPLQTINNLLEGQNCIFYGKDINQINVMVNELKKLNWAIPLAYSMNERIISTKEAETLAKLPSLECIRAETCSIIMDNTDMDYLSKVFPRFR